MADVILHNRPEGTPSDNEFVAYGTPTTPSGQIKMSNFYNLLMSKLGFFKVSNLFSEIFGNISATTTARANLGVYSISEVQGQVTQRALKTNVIEKDNTVSYVPSLPYHPVNKKYVDDNILFVGKTIYHDDNIGHTDVVKLGGTKSPVGMTYGRPYGDFVHEFSHNLNMSNYFPVVNIHNALNRDNVVLGTVSWDSNKVSFKAETTDNFQDSVAEYTIMLLKL